jgi:APA family basic amino acid/polyamine antiporter
MAGTTNPLRRDLSFRDVVFAGIGGIIGAGIFALLGSAAAEAGNAVWLSFIIAGIASMFTALSYAELASMFPGPGAEFDYITESFGRRAGFVTGCVILSACIIGGAMVMTSCADYAASITGAPPAVIACLLVPVFLLLLLRGVKDVARFVIVVTAAEVGCLACLILVSLPYAGSQDYLVMPRGFGGVLSASAMVFVAYAGFESIVKFSGETRNPERAIPRALLLALLAVTALYAAAAFGSVSVAGWSALANSPTPITLVFMQALSLNSGAFISAIIVFGTANTAVMILYAASRILYGMSCAGVMPASLSVLSAEWHIPSKAVTVVCLCVLPFLAAGSMAFLAGLASFFYISAYVMVNAGVIALRLSSPSRTRPFAIPLSIRNIPVPSVLGIMVSALLIVLSPADVLSAGLACLLLIGILTLLAVRRGYL